MEIAGGASIEFGVASSALAGQAESGDRYLVEPLPNGVLIAAVDGLGHGGEAAAAARAALEIMKEHAEDPPSTLVRLCHEKLVSTRGVVMNLAVIHDGNRTMSWLGVGNVEGLLLRAQPEAGVAEDQALLQRSGVVGARLPSLQPRVLTLEVGDTLIFATDGIRSEFARTVRRRDAPQPIADRILAQHHKGTDDALVLVVRYLGDGRT